MELTYKNHAPFEVHTIRGREIGVVRADLVPNPPMPAYLKMIELLKFVEYLKEKHDPKVIGYYAQDQSEWTRVLPMVCKSFGIKGLVGFSKKKEIPEFVRRIKDDNIYWMTPNMYGVQWGRMRKHVEGLGGYMLPMGVDHPFVVKSIKEFFDSDPIPTSFGHGKVRTVVVPVGSGVALSGICQHLEGAHLKIIGVVSRSPKSVRKVTDKYYGESNLKLVEGPAEDLKPMPFPGHRFWELQTWNWISRNLDSLEKGIVYINLGS